MKRFFIINMTIIFCIPLFTFNVNAETKAEKYLGQKEMCLETIRIKETSVLDNQTILFEMRDGSIYINRLPAASPGLKIAGGFQYSTSIAKLCKQDSIKTVSPGSAPASTAMLGDFIKFKEKGTINHVEKLLEGGLLKELVDENAFTEISTEKK